MGEQVDMEDGSKGGTSWNEEFYTGVGFPNFIFSGMIISPLLSDNGVREVING